MIYREAPHEILTVIFFSLLLSSIGDVAVVYIVLIRIVLNHLIDQSERSVCIGIAFSSKCAIINGSRTECHQEDEMKTTPFSHIKCLFTFILPLVCVCAVASSQSFAF